MYSINNLMIDKKKEKPPKKKQNEIFETKKNKDDLSAVQMKKIKEHSKMHKGGMSSPHIKNMIKFMKPPKKLSFDQAHKEAVKIDTKSDKMSKNRQIKKRNIIKRSY